MHNWKWVNLSKMAGFNISLSLNERQSSSDKKHNKSLRLVLFFPFRCCFAGSLPFSLSTVKQTKLFHSISEMFFTFLARQTLWVKLFSFAILIGRIIFSTCENHCSLLWLARTNLRRKICNIAVWWVFPIIYVINSNMPKPWRWYHFRAELLRVRHCREYFSRLTRFTE